jgi:anti-sigma factor RsiW
MNPMTCDQVRELLPELVRGELPEASLVTAESHLAGCPDCRAERAMLERVATALASVPAGLEARVLAALRARPAVRSFNRPTQLAAAATVAAAVIGGALMLDRAGSSRSALTAGEEPATASALLPLTDPLLHGSLLPELTEAELEALLEEMDS